MVDAHYTIAFAALLWWMNRDAGQRRNHNTSEGREGSKEKEPKEVSATQKQQEKGPTKAAATQEEQGAEQLELQRSKWRRNKTKEASCAKHRLSSHHYACCSRW